MLLTAGAGAGCCPRVVRAHVHLPGQVLPRRRLRGAGAGEHTAPVFPAGQTVHPQHGHLLPPRGLGASCLLCCPGKGTNTL